MSTELELLKKSRNVVPIGSFSSVRRGASPRPITDPKYFGGDVGWVRISDVTQRNKKYLRKTVQYVSPLGESKSLRVNQGDIIMSICATVGKPMLVDMSACIHDGFVQFYDLKEIDTEYLYYILGFHEQDFINRAQPGTQINLNTTIVRNQKVFFPPLPQQRKIAKILSTCDEVIDKTESLIKKYEAMKEGLMHDLFTRGIDPKTKELRPKPQDAPELYKDSELGLIPKDWEVKELGKVCSESGGNIQTGPFGSQLHAEDYKETGTPIITVEHLGDNEILHKNLPLVGSADCQRLKKYQILKGDLVFSRVGSIDRCAYVKDSEDGWLFSGRCLRVRMGSKRVNSKFYSYLLNNRPSRNWILNHAVGSTMPCLNTQILSSLPVSKPCLVEQELVKDKLDSISNNSNLYRKDALKWNSIKKGLLQDLLSGE